MNHPDFRVSGQIFATLPNPDNGRAMVKLPPDQQKAFIDLQPSAFTPVKGKWGEQGATIVVLKAVKEESLRGAMTLAWQQASKPRPKAPSSRAKR
jgi:hypothetical protein